MQTLTPEQAQAAYDILRMGAQLSFPNGIEIVPDLQRGLLDVNGLGYLKQVQLNVPTVKQILEEHCEAYAASISL